MHVTRNWYEISWLLQHCVTVHLLLSLSSNPILIFCVYSLLFLLHSILLHVLNRNEVQQEFLKNILKQPNYSRTAARSAVPAKEVSHFCRCEGSNHAKEDKCCHSCGPQDLDLPGLHQQTFVCSKCLGWKSFGVIYTVNGNNTSLKGSCSNYVGTSYKQNSCTENL